MSDTAPTPVCDHEFDEVFYICKHCGYDCQGLAIDEAYSNYELERDSGDTHEV